MRLTPPVRPRRWVSFDAGLADRLARSVIRECFLRELVGIDLAGGSDELSGEAAEHVLAQRLVIELDPGKSEVVLRDLRALVEAEIGRERYRLESKSARRLPDLRRDLLRISPEDRAENRVDPPGIADFIRHHVYVIGRTARGDRTTIAVDDHPARCVELNGTNVVRLRAPLQVLTLEDLELKEASDEDGEECEDDEDQRPEPDIAGTIRAVRETTVAQRLTHDRPLPG
jgi:hypothetical protein